MNTVAIAGSPKRSSCIRSLFINTLVSTLGLVKGLLSGSQAATTSVPSATTGSACRVFAMRSMVRSPCKEGGLELLAARAAPNAQPRGTEHRAGKFDDDRQYVRADEGVGAWVVEAGCHTGDDLLELREVEEERIVADSGEHFYPATCGDDRRLPVSHEHRGGLRAVDDAIDDPDLRRRGGAAEMHHLVATRARDERLNHEILDRVPVIVDLPLVEDVRVEERGACFRRRDEAGHGHHQNEVVRVGGAAEGVKVSNVGRVVRGQERAVLVVGGLDPSGEAERCSGREQQAPRDQAAARRGRSKAEHGSFLLEKENGRRATSSLRPSWSFGLPRANRRPARIPPGTVAGWVAESRPRALRSRRSDRV